MKYRIVSLVGAVLISAVLATMAAHAKCTTEFNKCDPKKLEGGLCKFACGADTTTWLAGKCTGGGPFSCDNMCKNDYDMKTNVVQNYTSNLDANGKCISCRESTKEVDQVLINCPNGDALCTNKVGCPE